MGDPTLNCVLLADRHHGLTEGVQVQQTLDRVIAELNTVVATITPAKTKK